MPDEPRIQESEAALPDMPAALAAVDLASVNANVASLRADASEMKLLLSALKLPLSALKEQGTDVQAALAAGKGDMTAVMTDVVRLDQKLERLAAALAATQQDVQRILRLTATKDDVARLLAAFEKKPIP